MTAKGAVASAIGASAVGALLASSQEASAGVPKKRPNILYILNDHQAYYGHGMRGGPKILRPHFDKFAAQGVEFSRAYCSSPLCSPSRRTMLTGLLPHNHGEIKNGSLHPYDTEVYTDTLASAGYGNFYYGKWHAGPGLPMDHHCEGFSMTGYNNPYPTEEYKDYLKQRDLPAPEVLIDRTMDPPVPPEKRTDKSIVAGEVLKSRMVNNGPYAGTLQTPEDTHEAFFLANLACDRLEKLAKDKTGQPWSMRVDFWGPHQPYFPSKRFLDMYKAEDIPEYPNFRDDLKNKPGRYSSDINYPISQNRRLIVPSPLPWPEWQKWLRFCYAHVTMIDEAAGRVLDTLERLGLDEDTLVIWSTDHGDALACHGGHFDKSGYMPEELMRIPFAVRFPGRIKPAQKRDEFVSNVDLAPTILDAAGLKFRKKIDGQSLLPLCQGKTKKWREDLMCETHGHWVNGLGRMIVYGNYKYVWNDDEMEELYDLKADPYEMNNLIASSQHQDVLKDMRSRLAKWQKRTGDDPDSPDSPWGKLTGRKTA